jgi:hypothetical protein
MTAVDRRAKRRVDRGTWEASRSRSREPPNFTIRFWHPEMSAVVRVPTTVASLLSSVDLGHLLSKLEALSTDDFDAMVQADKPKNMAKLKDLGVDKLQCVDECHKQKSRRSRVKPPRATARDAGHVDTCAAWTMAGSARRCAMLCPRRSARSTATACLSS